MNIKLIGIVVGSAVVSVASLVTSIATSVRAKRVTQKVEKSIGKVEELSEEKITDILIQKAVSNSADKMVDRYMQDTEDSVLRTASRNLDIQARNAVEKAADVIRNQASERISQQVAALDIEELKRRVCDQAEQHVLEKLDGVLDKSAKKFNDQLESTRKIYDKIHKAIAEKEEEENDGYHVVIL